MANLEIEIGAVTSGLDKGLKAAESKLQAFGKQATSLGKSLSKNVTAPLAAIGAAAFAASARVGNFADELLDLEQQTGLSTDALQEYRAVTTRAGIATDAVARASENLQRRLASGEEGSKDLTDGLAALGISARDATGNLRGIDEVLEESITALAGFENITERNQLALKIFGRSASELAPLLSLGADGIEDAKNRAQELGLVLSKEALEAANKFRIELDELKSTFSGVTNEIGIAFIPIAEKIVRLFQNIIVPAIRSVIKAFNGLSTTTKTVIAIVGGLVAAIGPLIAGVGFFATTILPVLKVGLAKITGLFSILTLKILGSIAVVVALGLIVKGLIDSWDVVGEFFSQLWDEIKITFINGAAAVLKAFNKLTSVIGLDFSDTIDGLIEDSARIKKALDEKPVVTLGDAWKALAGSIKGSVKEIRDAVVTGLGGGFDEVTEKSKLTFEQFSKLADIANEKVFAQFAADAAEFNNELEKNLALQARIAGAVGNIDTGPKVKNIGIGSIGGLPVVEIPQIDESKKTAFLASLQQFNDQASQILSSGISNAIGDFAFGLGEALGAGANVMDTIGAALLKGIAMIANQLGQAAIAIGVGMIAIKKSFSNPFTAIAAGAALVALAGVISSQVPKITAGGGGGTSGVGQSFSGSGVNTAFVDSFGALDIQGTSTIKGQDIIIAFDKANRTNGR
jgi:hypothetical protein